MNELSEPIKLARDAESCDEISPLAEVAVIVYTNPPVVKLVDDPTMVHGGGIAFSVLTDGWEFAHENGTHGVEFVDPNAPFDLCSETPKRIVFSDQYVQGNSAGAGSFRYTVHVQKSQVQSLSSIMRFFSPQQIDGLEGLSVDAQAVTASVFGTSGVVVNQ